MNPISFVMEGKSVSLYPASSDGCPLIVLNQYEGDGSEIYDAVREAADGKDFSLLCVSGIDWNHDMAPWSCPPIMPQDGAYTGGADDHLRLLKDSILPESLGKLPGRPSGIGIAGYSLAGLFALYALYKTDVFDRAASMSGSLWFPDFEEYVRSHSMKVVPEKLYLSLGDKEAKTRNPYLRTVQEHTERIAAYYRDAGLSVTWEMNPGNHFKDAERRIQKGILAIL